MPPVTYSGTQKHPSPTGKIRWQVMIDHRDDDCLEHLKARHFHGNVCDAARYAFLMREKTDTLFGFAHEPGLSKEERAEILSGISMIHSGNRCRVARAKKKAYQEVRYASFLSSQEKDQSVRDTIRTLDKETKGARKFCFWISPEEFQILHRIKERWRLRFLGEAFRLALRIQSCVEDFTPTEGWSDREETL